jgi:branched-chain amino acid aminotransferase
MPPSSSSPNTSIRLFTVHVRRGAPDVQDPKLNSHSKLNCILACVQAQKAGYDEALMLDPHGFVATCNSTHFFIVRRGQVWTSTGDYCLGGITRANVIALCREHGIPVFEKNFSLSDVYGAEEAFVTGTFAGLVPAREIDGRIMGDGKRGPMVARLQQLYMTLVEKESRAEPRV